MSAELVLHCELDDWDYDPRYTEGACPICRSGPPGAPRAPRWLLVSRRVPWDFAFLAALILASVALALVVATSSGLLTPPHVARPHLSLPALPWWLTRRH